MQRYGTASQVHELKVLAYRAAEFLGTMGGQNKAPEKVSLPVRLTGSIIDINHSAPSVIKYTRRMPERQYIASSFGHRKG